jgi:acyl-CoA thioesterase FadM
MFDGVGVWLPRVHVECDFYHPVVLDELLVVEAWFGKIGTTSIHIDFEVRRKERPDVVVAGGKYIVVAVKKGEFAPTPVPEMLREKLAPYVEPR